MAIPKKRERVLLDWGQLWTTMRVAACFEADRVGYDALDYRAKEFIPDSFRPNAARHKEVPALYYVRLDNTEDGTELFKVGITTKSIGQRFSALSKPWVVGEEIVFETYESAGYALHAETLVKAVGNPYTLPRDKYVALGHRFCHAAGRTETFTRDVLQEDIGWSPGVRVSEYLEDNAISILARLLERVGLRPERLVLVEGR